MSSIVFLMTFPTIPFWLGRSLWTGSQKSAGPPKSAGPEKRHGPKKCGPRKARGPQTTGPQHRKPRGPKECGASTFSQGPVEIYKFYTEEAKQPYPSQRGTRASAENEFFIFD